MNKPNEYSVKGLVGEEIHILEPQIKANANSDAIFDYSANIEQIEQWWYAKDPLNITDILRQEAVSMAGDRDLTVAHHNDTFKDCLISGRGGASIAANILELDILSISGDEKSQPSKKSYIGKLLSKREIQQPRKSRQIAVLDECLQEFANAPDELIEKNASKFILAAEMLRLSTGETSEMIAGSNVVTYKDEKEKQKIANELADSNMLNLAFHQTAFEDVQEICAKQYQLSEKILSKLAEVLVFQRLGDQYNFVDDKHMLGIKSLTILSADKMGLSLNQPNSAKGNLNKDYFKALMGAISLVFSKDRLGNKTIRPNIKGSLHETMWFLDAFVARMIEPDKYGEIEVTPAYSKDDASRLNYPELRRNIDMLVSYHHLTDYIQLKSSPLNSNKPGHKNTRKKVGSIATKFAFPGGYHPAVTVIGEKNFKEVQTKRLNNKINKYKEWVDSGFDDSMKQELQKNIMPSVTSEFDKIISDYNNGNDSLPQQTKDTLIRETLGRQKSKSKSKRQAQKAARKQNRRSK